MAPITKPHIKLLQFIAANPRCSYTDVINSAAPRLSYIEAENLLSYLLEENMVSPIGENIDNPPLFIAPRGTNALIQFKEERADWRFSRTMQILGLASSVLFALTGILLEHFTGVCDALLSLFR